MPMPRRGSEDVNTDKTDLSSWFEIPEPLKVEENKDGFIIEFDDGYRTSVEFSHECSLNDIYYYDWGWMCTACGIQFGENEALDRILIHNKIMCVADDLHEDGKIQFSNHTHFLACLDTVLPKCVESNKFDKESIKKFILDYFEVE
jgi:hypothetical protein